MTSILSKVKIEASGAGSTDYTLLFPLTNIKVLLQRKLFLHYYDSLPTNPADSHLHTHANESVSNLAVNLQPDIARVQINSLINNNNNNKKARAVNLVTHLSTKTNTDGYWLFPHSSSN